MTRNIFKKISVATVAVLALAVLMRDNLYALGVDDGIGAAKGGGQSTKTVEGTIGTIVSIAMWAVGILSVIMLVFGGIKYATSAGDEKKVTSAKHTIIYAIVGLAVAILAWTISNFVFSALQ